MLDLFAGIGGFSLGLERAGGFVTVAFCEIEAFPRAVLARHWPGVPIFNDVRTLSAQQLAADGVAVDVICGGFPCQDISLAGSGAGLAGARSGLWSHFARLVGELRPRHVIVENVAALRSRGLGTVLGDLAALGYDAEWHCIPASAVGARHRRDRVWIIADACGEGLPQPERPRICGTWWRQERGAIAERTTWAGASDVGRGIYGLSDRVDRRARIEGLGNAVVPQIPELIGRAIMAAEAALAD